MCKSSSGYSESRGKKNESENKRFTSHVNYRYLFHRECIYYNKLIFQKIVLNSFLFRHPSLLHCKSNIIIHPKENG
jgi:hypothetical protein